LVLENNQWAYSTPVGRQVPLDNLADRAKAYGIRSYTVDGNDVVAVYTTAKEAVQRARKGEGPILLEVKTFRRMGHAQHDPADYVPKEMRAYWEAGDPIALYEKFLTSEKLLDAKDKKEIEDKIDTLLAKERDFAENSPMPPPEFAAEGVYCTGDDCHKIRPKWERPVSEVTPPKSSVSAVWTVAGFGSGKSTDGGSAPIHFGDTEKHAKDDASAEEASRTNGKTRAAKAAVKKSAKPVALASKSKAQARKAGR